MQLNINQDRPMNSQVSDQDRENNQKSFQRSGDLITQFKQRDNKNYSQSANRYIFRYEQENSTYYGENVVRNMVSVQGSFRNDESNYDASNMGDQLISDRSKKNAANNI